MGSDDTCIGESFLMVPHGIGRGILAFACCIVFYGLT